MLDPIRFQKEMRTFCGLQFIQKKKQLKVSAHTAFLILVLSPSSSNFDKGFFVTRLSSLLELFNGKDNKEKYVHFWIF